MESCFAEQEERAERAAAAAAKAARLEEELLAEWFQDLEKAAITPPYPAG